MPKPAPRAKLPRFASRRQKQKRAAGRVKLQPVFDVVHKIITAGAALTTILRLLF